MMQVSLPLVAFALCYCCFHLLLLLCVSVLADANSTADSCTSSFMQCAGLINITYPFWGSASCAASPSYVLSNCSSSSTEVYWDSFSIAATGVVGPPLVTAIDVMPIEDYSCRAQYYCPFYACNCYRCCRSSPRSCYRCLLSSATGVVGPPLVTAIETAIRLSWNKTFIAMEYCAPLFSSKNLSSYNIPSSINLTRFSNSSAVKFSTDNTFLLFNCTKYNTSNVVVLELDPQNFQTDSDNRCTSYKGLCTSLAKTPCIEWLVPSSMKELPLQRVLDSLDCSHFMFGVSSPTGLHVTWSTGSIELLWTDIQCEKCRNPYGRCIQDTIIPQKFNYCDYGTPFTKCKGGLLQCNTGANIGLAVFVVVFVLGIWIVIRFRSNFSDLWTMIREGIRNAWVSFTRVTIPVAISILKGALRKLQSVSYGHDTSLDAIDFDGLTERPMELSYSAIASATKSFSSLVGEGGFGSVYKGVFTQSNNQGGSNSELQIAVKVLEVKSKNIKKQFLNEVITIGRIHHVNVVRLLGFCMQEDHEMLVYEYVVNKSLDGWLFVDRGKGPDKILNWEQRYAIALGVARGLSYLHEECRHRTIHCDIKPQNILLDENMHPKIADFGLARLMGRDESKVMTFAKGTPGYMAPEFWMGGEAQLSTKFDVYSYGMVLLELISGRRNFRHNATLSGNSSFPAMAFKATIEGDLQSILDSRLITDTNDNDEAQITQVQWDQIRMAALVALWCIQDHPASRPNMSEVVKYLEGGASISKNPPQPNISTFSRSPGTQKESASSNYEDDWTNLSIGR